MGAIVSSESIDDRKRLLRRLLDDASDYQINDIPPPGDGAVRSLSAAEISGQWSQLAEDLRGGALPGHYANVYLHVPFCRSKCTYCMYDSRLLGDDEIAAGYAAFIEAQARYFGAAVDGLSFQNLHVGGGTPTLLDETLLRRMLDAVLGEMRFAEDASKVVETNPDNVTPSKAKLLVDCGFNKISMGVQSMDSGVLQRHGRGHQTRSQVRDALASLRAAGAPYVNCDFIVGLAGDGARTFLDGLAELFDLGPDTVMLTKLQPQWGYLRRHFRGSYTHFADGFDAEYRPIFGSMLELAERAGYETDNPLESEVGWRFWRRGFRPPYDEQRPYCCTAGAQPSSTLGIGRFARSNIFGRLVYEQDGAKVASGAAEARFRGYQSSLGYEAARWTISQIAARRQLDRRRFRSLFGAEPEEIFPGVLEALRANGDAKQEDDILRFVASTTRELFILTRQFLDRRAVLGELANVDRAAVTIDVASTRLRFWVEQVRRRSDYIETAGPIGLRLEASTSSVKPSSTLVVGVLLQLFRRALRRRPWASATEVAEWMCARSQNLLSDAHDVAVSLERAATTTMSLGSR